MGVVRSNASQHKSNSTINLDETSNKTNQNSFKSNVKKLNLPCDDQNGCRRLSMNYESNKNHLKNSASSNRMSEEISFLLQVFVYILMSSVL